jgi:acyl-coenzyme A thioesterase PaaI-like protein
MAPYSGSISPRVEEIRPGYARVAMQDRRAVRNHLRSVHAVALLNLAELSSGLALNYALPDDARAILTGLSMEYLKKARGRLTAEAEVEVPRTNEEREYELESVIRDEAGEVVARARARWLVGPA